MKIIITFFIICICLSSCQENEQQVSSNQQASVDSKKDSVMIQPIDLNNTVFMMHYHIISLVDSVFFAPPDKMEGIYKDLLFELDIVISDIQNMDFQFEGSEKLIQSIEKLMLKFKDLLKTKFPMFIEIQQSKKITDEEKSKIQKFHDDYDDEIIPLTKEFFKAQEEFAQKHKIELVDY